MSNKLIVLCHLPPGCLTIKESTGFASINPQFPGIEADPRIVNMVRVYNDRIEYFQKLEASGNEAAGESAQELILGRQEFFEKSIQKWWGRKAITKDVDFLEVVEVPKNWGYQIVKGRSGYEELLIWEIGSSKVHVYNPDI
jgi:hypothetical protein